MGVESGWTGDASSSREISGRRPPRIFDISLSFLTDKTLRFPTFSKLSGRNQRRNYFFWEREGRFGCLNVPQAKLRGDALELYCLLPDFRPNCHQSESPGGSGGGTSRVMDTQRFKVACLPPAKTVNQCEFFTTLDDFFLQI